jgi:hypothetical protein
MHKTIGSFFLLATTFLIASELPPPKTAELLQIAEPAFTPTKKGTVYFRAVTNSQTSQSKDVFPGFGLGYRKAFGYSAVDVSFNFSGGEGWDGNQSSVVWTAPRASYLYYFNPLKNSSLYAGTGLGWGGVLYETSTTFHDEDEDIIMESNTISGFIGLIPHATIGYEFLRNSVITSFIEFNVSQPLIPNSFEGTKKPSTILEVSLGAGF